MYIHLVSLFNTSWHKGSCRYYFYFIFRVWKYHLQSFVDFRHIKASREVTLVLVRSHTDIAQGKPGFESRRGRNFLI